MQQTALKICIHWSILKNQNINIFQNCQMETAKEGNLLHSMVRNELFGIAYCKSTNFDRYKIWRVDHFLSDNRGFSLYNPI